MNKSESIKEFYLNFYRKFFSYLFSISLILSIPLILFSLIALLSNDRTVLGLNLEVVESDSMVPAFKRGDLLIVKEKSVYEIGDVITFAPYSNALDKTFTHRIVDFNTATETYETQGDANENPDPFEIERSSITGAVLMTLYGWGNIILFSRSIEGIILLLIIPATVLLTIVVKDSLG